MIRSLRTYRPGDILRLIALCLLVLMFTVTSAQLSHTKTVLDNGGGSTVSTNWNVTASIGHPIIGSSNSTDFKISAGFIKENFEVIGIATITSEVLPDFYELGTGGLTLSITVNNENLVNQMTFAFRKLSSPSDTPSQQTLTSDGSNNYSVTLTDDVFSDDIGITYSFTISSVNGAQLERSNITYLAVSDGAEPIPGLRFGSAVSDYQIISVPYELDNRGVLSVFDELVPYDNTRWRIFTYSNGQTIEYSTFSNIEVGRGYWLIVADQTTISLGAGNLPTLTPSAPFEITLEPGWNQLGNPFTYSIDWSGVLQQNGNPNGISDLFQLNGTSLGSNNTLEAFRGGFVENSTSSAVVVQLPLDRSAIGGRKSGRISNEPMRNPIDNSQWLVNLTLTDGTLTNQLGGIGMHSDASLLQDQFDVSLFPVPFEMAKIKFDVGGKNLSRNVVPASNDHIWEFEISGSANVVDLNWDNSYFGNNEMHLVLLDLDAGRRIDMREDDSYSISPTGPRNFKILYGTFEFIEENALPAAFGLGDLYPNPFNSELNIPVTIKGKRELTFNVDIDMHDLSGRKVTNVWQGELRPGFYEIKWGRDLSAVQMPPGVYYVVMNVAGDSNDKILTKKIIIK